jgi:hypothetical protein
MLWGVPISECSYIGGPYIRGSLYMPLRPVTSGSSGDDGVMMRYSRTPAAVMMV